MEDDNDVIVANVPLSDQLLFFSDLIRDHGADMEHDIKDRGVGLEAGADRMGAVAVVQHIQPTVEPLVAFQRHLVAKKVQEFLELLCFRGVLIDLFVGAAHHVARQSVQHTDAALVVSHSLHLIVGNQLLLKCHHQRWKKGLMFRL